MNEVLETGDVVANAADYTELLTMIHEELLLHTEYLSGIYGLGWVLCGVIVGCVSCYFIYKLLIT